MKRIPLILSVLLGLAACKTTIHDSGCISRYTGNAFIPYISASNSDTAKALFAANNLSAAGVDFVYYYSSFQRNPQDTTVIWYTQYVTAGLYINGLPVFQSNEDWIFHDGVLVPQPPAPAIPNPGNDTAGHQTLPQLRALFLKSFDTALYMNKQNYADGRMGRPGIYYRDSCLLAQLGYVDAASQPPYTTAYGTKYLKVWRIVPSSFFQPPVLQTTPFYQYGRTLPVVYVVDASGDAWCTNATYPGQHLIYNPTL